jgi:hypothetical protein
MRSTEPLQTYHARESVNPRRCADDAVQRCQLLPVESVKRSRRMAASFQGLFWPKEGRAMVFNDSEREQFISDGYVVLRAAFSRDLAEECREFVWLFSEAG